MDVHTKESIFQVYTDYSHHIELSVKIFPCVILYAGPYGSHNHGILRDLNVEGRCQKRFWCDALHHKVRSTSHKIRDMEAQFQLLHRKNLSPSPDVLKEYKQLIESAEQQVGSMWSGIL